MTLLSRHNEAAKNLSLLELEWLAVFLAKRILQTGVGLRPFGELPQAFSTKVQFINLQ
jgi:hypothetical protein